MSSTPFELHDVGKAPVTAAERAASVVLLSRPADAASPDTAEPPDGWSGVLHDTLYRVARLGGTEPRGLTRKFGGFDDFFEEGLYRCVCCSAELYDSGTKFDCGCGWAGFWSCRLGAVLAVPDPDGVRTEIRCVRCDSHLGHVLLGEGFSNPAPNQRHCVDSCSVTFEARDTGERTRCTYNGPVFMHAGRRPGEGSSIFRDLAGGEELPANQVWVCIDTQLTMVDGLSPGISFGDLHTRLVEAGGSRLEEADEFYLREGEALRVVAPGDSDLAPVGLLRCVDVLSKRTAAREL